LAPDAVLCRLVIDELFAGAIRSLTQPFARGIQFKNPGPAEPELSTGRMRLVEFEKDGKAIRELRITISDPGEKNHPERYRCSVGVAKKEPTGAPNAPADPLNPVRQTGLPRGILSVLGDRSVEIVGDLNVFASRETIMPGLVLKIAPPAKEGAAGGEQASEPAPVLIDAVIWDDMTMERREADGDHAEQLTLAGKLRNLTDVRVESITIFLTIYAKGAADPPPRQTSFKAMHPLEANSAIATTVLFPPMYVSTSEFSGKSIVVNILLLGANANTAIIKTQVQVELGKSAKLTQE
jgi:hypothetical protein